MISKHALISNYGLCDGRDLYWTDQKDIELPIIVKEGDDVPLRTIPQALKEAVKKTPYAVYFKVKRFLHKDASKPKHMKWTYKQAWKEINKFAAALVQVRISERGCINILGFNSPEWAIAFFGSMVANCIPSGVYLTNSPEACLY